MKRLLIAVALLGAASWAQADVSLASWNDSPARRNIIEFVQRVTEEGSKSYVPPDQRIAAIDNDGTLWSEQPMYFQYMFAMDRVKAMAPQHPEWQTKEPFKFLLNGDMKSFVDGGDASVLAVVAELYSGTTTDEFQAVVKEWLRVARHPTTGRPYTAMVYRPMLELLGFLRSNGFKTFIVTGGGVEFVRTMAEQTYGIPPEQVLATSNKLKYELRDGKPVLVNTAELQFMNNREGKVIGIQTFIGRRPILAIGNADVDLQMLQWTTTLNSGPWANLTGSPRMAILIHHDDAVREWAYDRKSSIGRQDKVLDEARAKKWQIVSMRDDWRRMFVNNQEDQP